MDGNGMAMMTIKIRGADAIAALQNGWALGGAQGNLAGSAGAQMNLMAAQHGMMRGGEMEGQRMMGAKMMGKGMGAKMVGKKGGQFLLLGAGPGGRDVLLQAGKIESGKAMLTQHGLMVRGVEIEKGRLFILNKGVLAGGGAGLPGAAAGKGATLGASAAMTSKGVVLGAATPAASAAPSAVAASAAPGILGVMAAPAAVAAPAAAAGTSPAAAAAAVGTAKALGAGAGAAAAKTGMAAGAAATSGSLLSATGLSLGLGFGLGAIGPVLLLGTAGLCAAGAYLYIRNRNQFEVYEDGERL